MFTRKDLMNVEGLMILSSIKRTAQKNNAAKALNTSVDTLNKYLENLETELGTKLVSTSGRGCFLTRDGEKLAELSEQLKSFLQQIYSLTAANTPHEISGEIRIAYDRNVRNNTSFWSMQNFYDNYPFLSIVIDTYDGTPEISKLGYDIGLSYSIPTGNDIVVIASKETPFGFFASANYLSNYPYPQSEEDLLENHRIIMKKASKNFFNSFDRFAQKAKKGLCMTNSAYVVNELIMNNCGVAIMPLSFAKQQNDLVCLDNITCPATQTIYLTSQKIIKDVPKVRLALEYYKEMLKNL